MAPGNSFNTWLNQAKYDLEAAKLSRSEGFYEWSCYQSNQCVEKVLKAVLVHSGARPPRVHKFGVLAGMANKANNAFIKIDLDFRKVEAYTFLSRYPYLLPDENKPPHEFITKKDADTCIELAGSIYSKVNDFLLKSTPKSGKLKVVSMETKYFTKEEVEKRKKEIVEELMYSKLLDIHKIILYGSFSREVTRPKTTTLDILIIAETDLNFIERIQYVREITSKGMPIVEPLVYTPKEFNYMVGDEAEGYLESAIDEGIVLFDRDKYESN